MKLLGKLAMSGLILIVGNCGDTVRSVPAAAYIDICPTMDVKQLIVDTDPDTEAAIKANNFNFGTGCSDG